MKLSPSILLLFIFKLVYSQPNQPPIVLASGNQAYCPFTQLPIVTTFSITDIDNVGVDAFYIQISSGYQTGSDQLVLTGAHATIINSWNASEGKLTLTGIHGNQIHLSDLENAVRNIVFQSSSTNLTQEKVFSLTVGDANYLAQTGHYYEYVSNQGVTWNDAKVFAEARTYFGLQGYLATITSEEEAQLIGEQATGTGWIGGSDEAQEGVWKWVSGPEAGTVFWNGNENGSTPNFAFWNTNEPNNQGSENYAHITDPNIGILGSWNDLANQGGNGLYVSRGYVVEYGGMPGDPNVSISASSRIFIPEITTFTEAAVCQSGSVTLSAAANIGTVLWFSDDSGGTPVGMGNNFVTPNLTSTTTFYAAASVNGCTTSPRTAITATVNTIPIITNTTGAQICGAGTVIISATTSEGTVAWYESLTSNTPVFIGNNFETFVTTSTTFYVRSISAGCTSVRIPVEVLVETTIPTFTVDRNVTLCLDKQFVDVKAINATGTISAYEWKDQNNSIISTSETARITSEGTYFVIARSTSGCNSEEIEIKVTTSEKAIITISDVIISDDSQNNAITIFSNQLGIGEYLFALDDINGSYTSQTFYQNLSTGLHKLYIKDTKGCGTQEFEFILLNYPSFFTPNGDFLNETWTLKGFEKSFFIINDVIIFNRFGRVLKQLKPDDLTWDGTYNGEELPSDSYWYKASLIDVNGRRIEKTGSFSLLRN